MPIGDLLAQIEGKDAPAPRPLKKTTPPLKRKADDDHRESPARKTPRPATPSNGLSSRPAPAPTSANQPASGPSSKQASSARPADRVPVTTMRKSVTSTLPSRPSPASTSGSRTHASSLANNEKPIKKGSFAELMARAQRNQTMVKNAGIQHKPIERGLSKKEREEAKAEQTRRVKTDSRNTKRSTTAGKTGASSLGRETGYKGTARNGSALGSKKGAPPPLEPEKKVKKAALATTGYTGTARPRPGATISAKSTNGSRPSSAGRDIGRTQERGVDRRNPYGPFGGSRRNRSRYEDDYDDEMDDFVVDDDDEADDEPRYAEYESDESDMEAGYDDVYMEEERAKRAAIEDDKKEEALLARLKREKELKKRQLSSGRR